MNSSLKKNVFNKNFDCFNGKNKLLKEISFFKNSLISDVPVSSNRPIAFSNNKESKFNASEYFEFSPTKDSRQKGLINASYMKILREKQQVSSVIQNKSYFRNKVENIEKENSFDIFMKEFKVDKNMKNHFVKKLKDS